MLGSPSCGRQLRHRGEEGMRHGTLEHPVRIVQVTQKMVKPATRTQRRGLRHAANANPDKTRTQRQGL